MSGDYHTQMLLAWTIRLAMMFGLLMIVAIMGGCSHTLSLNSSGDLKKDPQQTSTTP